jgi:hypothetical protein
MITTSETTATSLSMEISFASKFSTKMAMGRIYLNDDNYIALVEFIQAQQKKDPPNGTV